MKKRPTTQNQQGEVKEPCKICKKTSRMLWLKQDTWNQISETHGDVKGGQVCFKCLNARSPHNLTLHDLDLQRYLETARHPKHTPGQIRKYVQILVIGACEELDVPWPEHFFNFEDPILKGMAKQMAKNTTVGAKEVIQVLIKQADEFPYDLRQTDSPRISQPDITKPR